MYWGLCCGGAVCLLTRVSVTSPFCFKVGISRISGPMVGSDVLPMILYPNLFPESG